MLLYNCFLSCLLRVMMELENYLRETHFKVGFISRNIAKKYKRKNKFLEGDKMQILSLHFVKRWKLC